MNNLNANSASKNEDTQRPITDSGDKLHAKLTLEDRVRLSFEQLGYPQLHSVRCTAEGDQMLLTGELHSFYLKQVAQSVAVKIPGVRVVRNEIEVR